ncbi:MAG TPA: hypothetical protein VND93_10955 [Myxococcales bacterium]|jgi:hypothetical protein|nr:hypothetical protein [Myxococcales bacterium]
MKRRTVLKAGMGGLVGMAAVESGCATAPVRPELPPQALDPAAAEAALARIDARMATFEQFDVDLPEDMPHHQKETLKTRAEMTRKALRSLYLAGAFQQLDEPLRYHPGVQDRVRRMQGEMDDTMRGVTDHLASLSPPERAQIQQSLAADPSIGEALVQHIHDTAREDGFRLGQRTDLRFTFGDMERKMRTKNASALIDRTVQRARTMRAREGRLGEHVFSAHLGEQAFREMKQRAFTYAAGWEHVYAARPRIDRARLEELYPPDQGGGGGLTREDLEGEKSQRQTTTAPPPAAPAAPAPEGTSGQAFTDEVVSNPASSTVLTVGSWMLGIGAIIEVTGLILFFGPGIGNTAVQTLGGIMCLGIGPLLLGLGLIVTIVGGIMSIPTHRRVPRSAPAPAPASPQPPPPAAPQI